MRQLSIRGARVAALLVLLAITGHASAAPAGIDERLTLRDYVKKYIARVVVKACDMLGTPPG
jgi:hypothetical protein